MDPRDAYLLEEAERWEQEGLISREQLAAIRARYAEPASDVRRQLLIRACLVIGVLGLLLGTYRAFADLRLGASALSAAQGVLAAAALAAGLRMRRTRPRARAAQALIYLGALFYLGALGLGAYDFGWLDLRRSPWLFLAGGAPVAALGLGLRFAKLHAIGAGLVAIAVGIWLHRAGLEAAYVPLAVTAAIAAIGLVAGRRMPEGFRAIYVLVGLAGLGLSVWGLELRAEGAERWAWALALAAAGSLPLAVGWRERDEAAAGLGIALWVLGVYTQYYFLLWGWVPRAAFFLVGGAITLGFGIGYERLLLEGRPVRVWFRRRD